MLIFRGVKMKEFPKEEIHLSKLLSREKFQKFPNGGRSI